MSNSSGNLNNKPKEQKVIILGGGLAGLVAADKLLDASDTNDTNLQVKILEGASFLGGLASSFPMNGEEIPKFNHHIVRSNKKTLEYLNRYNLLGKNIWKKIRVGIAVDGVIYNINNPFHLLKFKELTLYGKFRFGLFGVYSIFLLNPNKINENLDLETWLHKYAGKEVTEKVWTQLYGRNKFNIPLKKLDTDTLVCYSFFVSSFPHTILYIRFSLVMVNPRCPSHLKNP